MTRARAARAATPQSWLRAPVRGIVARGVVGWALALAALSVEPGCHHGEAKSPDNCRKDTGDDVKMAARTTGAAVKAGATTAWEGIKTGGNSAAGLVTDGTSGAKGNWNEGKQATKAKAHEGAADVKQESHVPPCK